MSTEGEIESFLSSHRRVFSPRFAEGDVIGDWRIVAFIARGGTAEVYRAERGMPSDSRGVGQSGAPEVNHVGREVVALKVLHKNDEVHRQRLAREAEFLRTHKHSAFPVLLDSRIAEDGPSYLAEEFLYPLELPRKDGAVAQLMQKLCAAVGYLHGRGLVHRDLKPSNIMTRREGGTDPVIVDFGLLRTGASAAVPRADSLTIENGRPVGVGTPGYGAPEQFIGGEVSPSVDIHALGVLADRCFEGAPSATWERIIRRATSSLPNLRYSTAASMARSIRHRHLMRNLVLWIVVAVVLAFSCMAFVDDRTGPARYEQSPSVLRVDRQSVPMVRSESTIVTNLYVQLGADDYVADGSKAYPYGSVARALSVATNGMTVVVGPGEHLGVVTLTREGVRLVSSDGPEKTIIGGERGRSVIRLTESTRHCEIRGFTVRGGTGRAVPSSYGYDFGGGGICSDGKENIIADCVVTNNGFGTPRRDSGTFGGGVWIGRGSAMVTNCLVRDNFAWACGGGICIGNGASAEIVGCTVDGNSSTDFFGHQGGIGIAEGSSARIVNTMVKGNTGDQLGAFGKPYNRRTSAEIVNCEISDGFDPHGIENFTVTPRTSPAPIGYRAP